MIPLFVGPVIEPNSLRKPFIASVSSETPPPPPPPELAISTRPPSKSRGRAISALPSSKTPLNTELKKLVILVAPAVILLSVCLKPFSAPAAAPKETGNSFAA